MNDDPLWDAWQNKRPDVSCFLQLVVADDVVLPPAALLVIHAALSNLSFPLKTSGDGICTLHSIDGFSNVFQVACLVPHATAAREISEAVRRAVLDSGVTQITGSFGFSLAFFTAKPRHE